MRPELSVLMVTYGARGWAERALRAVGAHTDVPYEVVVVDNGSRDGTPEMIATSFPTARLVRNVSNAGFGGANNQAAALATAPVLAFLNSDAIVPPGWAGPLLRALDQSGIGAVVPALVHDDGRLQSAGAVIGADASVLSLGDGASPDDPQFAFPRICDFGAAACMLVERTTFLGLGGFDRRYDPAYFEDVDLCLSLAERGLQTLYVPSVRVVHGIFGSGDADRAAELFWANQKPFLAKWGKRLRQDRVPTVWPPEPGRTLAARDALARSRILVLAGEALPSPHSADGALLTTLSDPVGGLRVTIMAATGDASEWAGRGAETFVAPDPAPLIRERLGHYDVVVGDLAAHAALLDQTQARAERVPAVAALRGRFAAGPPEPPPQGRSSG